MEIHCLCNTVVRKEKSGLINVVKPEINVDNDVSFLKLLGT